MALVKYGGGILNMSGSIGAQVHSHNRYGQYIRARTTPVNPQSGRQSEVRAIMAFFAQEWSNGLTQAQRDAWEVYAAAITRQNKLGSQIKLTGFNHYIRVNVARAQGNLADVSAGPTTLTLPPGDPVFACTVDEASQEISVVFDDTLAWNTQAGGGLLVSMSIPKAAGVNFIGGPFRFASTIVGVDPGGVASPQTMAVPFPVAEGQEIACSARIAEIDGRLSDPFRDQSSVTA